MIEQNLLNVAAQVEFIKSEHSVGKSPERFLFIETKSDIQVQENLDANVEENHPRGLPFDHGIKSL